MSSTHFSEWFERGHVAIVTGASKGLGRAVARELALVGVALVIDARDERALHEIERELAGSTAVTAIPGDVADASHLAELVAAARRFGRLDLIVNNASTIGVSPLPLLADIDGATLERIYAVNLFAPLRLIQLGLPLLRATQGTIVNITSDAAVEPYEGWGGYGPSKAALEHLSRILAAEIAPSGVRVIVADPGDLDTAMHAAAIPDADRSALTKPESVAPALLHAIAAAREPFTRVTLQRLAVNA